MAKPKESTFVLLSLKDSEAKKLGQVISSETARKILDALAEKKHTETELAEALQIPLSTVHYNIKALVDAKLVTADEYHYSEKGREVTHYGLANKYVIIAPASAESSVLNKIKSLLPVAILVAAVGWTVQWFSAVGKVQATSAPIISDIAVQRSAEAFTAQAPMLAEAAPTMAAKAAPVVTPSAAPIANALAAPEPVTGAPIALWFVLGAAFALTLYLLIDALRRKWK